MSRCRELTTVLDIDTPHGLARAHVSRAEDERAALVLGHGAGGGIAAGDLVAASEVALARGKKLHDKRQSLKEADDRREMDRALKHR